MKRALSFVITVYVSVPVLLYLFPWILGHAIYAHLVRLPFFVDLDRPEHLLNHTCNFYLNPEEGVSVGVWHTLPASQWEEAAGRSPEWHRETLGDGRPVIIYLHGNTGTRWDERRGTAGYHVLSIDYRGFGDSTGEPSEAGLTRDTLYLYQWAKNQSGGGFVCLWGHSLGTGVATNTALKHSCVITVNGKLLNISVFLQMYRFFPGFESLFLHIMELNNIEFANDENLKALISPLLILHAEDDRIVPYHMGLKVQPLFIHASSEDHFLVDIAASSLDYFAFFFFVSPAAPDFT
uniref:AB hydrolase-1 domain-containing protein n=1 Tax=Sparus aurata TaxID=8175 RepID=A0A671WFB2_SPAAU